MKYLTNILGAYSLTLAVLLGGALAIHVAGYQDTLAFVILGLAISAMIGEKIGRARSENTLVKLFLACMVVEAALIGITAAQSRSLEWIICGGALILINTILGCYALTKDINPKRRQFDGEMFYVEGRNERGLWRVYWCPDCKCLIEGVGAGQRTGVCPGCATTFRRLPDFTGVPHEERYWIEMLTPREPKRRISRTLPGNIADA